jgi:hypothetical protein
MQSVRGCYASTKCWRADMMPAPITRQDLLSTAVGRQLLSNLGNIQAADVMAMLSTKLYEHLSLAALHAAVSAEKSPEPSRSQRELAYAVADRLNDGWLARVLPTPIQAWSGPSAPRPDRFLPPTPGPLSHRRSKPRRGGLWTCSYLDDGYTSAWQPFLKSGYLGTTPQPRQWTMRVTVEPRSLFVILDAKDWFELCQRAPRREADGYSEPDWSVLAEEYAGIYLSPHGLLRAQEVVYRHRDTWTRLHGWDAETVLWLRYPVIANAM